MTRLCRWGSFSMALSAALCGAALAAVAKLPIIGGREALASINGDPVTFEEFYAQLSVMHQGVEAPGTKVARQRPWELLERLINIRLVLQEARNMGLDSLPEVKDLVATNRLETMRGILYRRRVQGITAADPAEVERIYKESIKQVRLSSILIEKEQDAKDLEAKVVAGGRFDTLASAMVSRGAAREDESGQYLPMDNLLPGVRQAVATMKVGDTSPLVRIGRSYSMMKLEDIRYPDDREKKEGAAKEALKQRQTAILKQYADDLKRQHTLVNDTVLKVVDYEAKEPGLEKLLADKRVVAEVKGEEPVTVGEMTDALRKRFFHGADRAITERKINARKMEVLDEILSKRAVHREAKRLKLDETEEFKRKVQEYEEGVLFGTFVQRVIDPSFKIGEPDLRTYLAAHREEYMSPEMIRLDALVFSDRTRAEDALAKLGKGADFLWMRANAEGQADPQVQKDLIQFPGTVVVTSSLPAGVQRAVEGVRSGEYRFYGENKGPWYVLHAREVLPPAPQPFEEIRDEVAKKVFEDKRQEAVKEWAQKLRKAYEVTMFVTREDLDQVLGNDRAGVKPQGAAGAPPKGAPASRPTDSR